MAIARFGLAGPGPSVISEPSASRVSTMNRGALCTPRFISVPYALAIDSGVTSAVVPRPKEVTLVANGLGLACVGRAVTTPASSIICLIRGRPASMASGT